jgi:hypothetical protein
LIELEDLALEEADGEVGGFELGLEAAVGVGGVAQLALGVYFGDDVIFLDGILETIADFEEPLEEGLAGGIAEGESEDALFALGAVGDLEGSADVADADVGGFEVLLGESELLAGLLGFLSVLAEGHLDFKAIGGLGTPDEIADALGIDAALEGFGDFGGEIDVGAAGGGFDFVEEADAAGDVEAGLEVVLVSPGDPGIEEAGDGEDAAADEGDSEEADEENDEDCG